MKEIILPLKIYKQYLRVFRGCKSVIHRPQVLVMIFACILSEGQGSTAVKFGLVMGPSLRLVFPVS